MRQESLAIAAGLKRQDVGLLDELIVRYQHRPAARYLLYLSGNRELAEDLFQEVWMRVMVRGAQFNGPGAVDTWLFTIARNLLIDQRRKKTMSSLDELFEVGGEDDRPMSFELADRRTDSFRPLRQRRRPRTDRLRAAGTGYALPRGAGAPLPRGVVAGRNRQSNPCASFHREIEALSWHGRT